ncbi:MAG: DUF4340 domain-containing protein [Brevinematia bacterium]
MKRLKSIIILFVFFLVMLILNIVRLYNQKETEKKSLFDNLNVANISQIELIDSKKHFIITNDNEWRIVYPFKELAAMDKVQKLFSELKKLKLIYTITNFSKVEDYGFSPYVLRIKLTGENLEETLDLGFKSVDERYRYLYYKNKLYVVEGDIEFLFDIDSIRDTTIFDINVDKINSIVVVNKNKKYNIIKKGENYYLNGKVISNFNEKLIDIYSLNISDFIESKVNKKPVYEVSLYSDDKTNFLWIYDNDIEGKWIAKSSEKNGYFLIENDDLENILTIKEK